MTTVNPSLSTDDVLNMLLEYSKCQILYSSCTLGVFDELHRSDKPMTARELATNLSLNPQATERLLNACTSASLLNKTCNSNGTAMYQNTSSSDMLLTKDSSTSIKQYVVLTNDLYAIYGKLSEAVKTGKIQFQSALGVGEDMFTPGSGFYSNQDKELVFLGSMHVMSNFDSAVAVRAFDLSKYKTACDLGGGSGALGVALAKAYPHMDVTVMDLQDVVDVMHHFLPKDKPANITLKRGNFFTDELPKVDLYMMARIVHDWGDDSLQKLLTRVHAALNPGGALLVLEKVLNDQKDGPAMAVFQDITMLLISDGYERTASEYKTLLEKHGFNSDIQIKLLPEAKFCDAILAHK